MVQCHHLSTHQTKGKLRWSSHRRGQTTPNQVTIHAARLLCPTPRMLLGKGPKGQPQRGSGGSEPGDHLPWALRPKDPSPPLRALAPPSSERRLRGGASERSSSRPRPQGCSPAKIRKAPFEPKFAAEWLGGRSEETGTGPGGAGDTRSRGRSLPAGAAQQALQAGERRAAVGPGPGVSRLHGGSGRRLVPGADRRRPARHPLGGREVRFSSDAAPRLVTAGARGARRFGARRTPGAGWAAAERH